MSRCRSIKQQFNYAISDNCRIGHSKRAENGTNTGYVYSVQYAENLRDTAKNLSNFLRLEYPEIKWIKDIKAEHLQAWVDTRSKKWSNATMINHISRVGILQKQILKTYKIDNDWTIITPVKENIGKVRKVAMERTDYDKLQELLDSGKSIAKYATAITARTGLRIKEIARLKVQNINLDKMVIEVRKGGKNGKYRDVPIRTEDKGYFEQLKIELSGQEYVCNGRTEDTINKGMRRALTKLGLSDKYQDTTNHAIRKMYARETYSQLMEKGMSEKSAWSEVQKNLGHGKKFRQSLFDTYIGK